MGKRKVTILEPAVEGVAHIALYIEGEGLPATAKNLLMKHLNFLKHLPMNVLRTVLVNTWRGNYLITAVLTLERNMWWLTSAAPVK
jgi:hypothetical protein